MNTTTSPTQPLVKKKALAEMLGVSMRTVDNWVARRQVPYLALSARLHLFDPNAVKAALVTQFSVQPKTASH